MARNNTGSRKRITIQMKRILFLLVGLLVLSLLCFLSVKIIDAPRYINVLIPSPISYLPHGGWTFEEKSTRIYMPQSETFFILRKESFAYGTYNSYDFNNIEGISRYFNDRLNELGWVRIPKDFPCIDLQEREMIIEKDGVIFEYKKIDDDINSRSRYICVSIWEKYKDRERPIFNVILMTVSPSLRTELLRTFSK